MKIFVCKERKTCARMQAGNCRENKIRLPPRVSPPPPPPQVPKPKTKPSKGEQATLQLLESLACDRQSQSGHMLLNLSQDNDSFVKEVVEAFGNRSGQGSLFEILFGAQAPAGPSFIGNDDIRSMATDMPDTADLAKWDNGEPRALLIHLKCQVPS